MVNKELPPTVFRVMRKRLTTIAAFSLMVGALALAGCGSVPGTSSGGSPLRPEHPATLERKVMVGYQGWFRTPGDGAGMGWAHYQKRNPPQMTAFSPDRLCVDYWPDVSELTDAEKYPTTLTHDDGSVAKVFSSHNPQTVDRHFRWMRDYGIDGAFVQRFSAPIISDNDMARVRLRAVDDVLRYARAGAERYGRSFVVMYDLSGMPAGKMGRVMQDWKHLVDDLKIRESSAYQYHRGRPVVTVWGVGFRDGRAYTLDEINALIEFLKDDPVYGGNTVMLGIPTWWREQSADAVSDPRLHALLKKADILSPWTPGRYYDLGGVRAHAERFWLPDRAWCAQRGLDYMPVVFPGFSWRNLKGVAGGIDRVDGRFLWEQYRLLVNHGFTMIYQAMFDEMDEGTQIFKTTNYPPREAYFVTYRPLPSDYYLWLVGTAAGDFFRRGNVLPERIVDRVGKPEINAYLRSKDDAVYAEAQQSFETHQRFFQIGDALVAHAPDWAPVGTNGGRIRVAGVWQPRYGWSSDATATVTWELAAPAAGDYALSIRYPGDPNNDHATGARLRVMQGDAILAEASVNLRKNTLRWIEIDRVRLSAGIPCQITLDQPAKTGILILFEPRLAPTK